MPHYHIALYPGDGIGLEVVPEAVKAMHATASRFGIALDFTEYTWGHRYWRETGEVAPENFLDQLRGFDAIFLGAVGDPEHLPDHVTLRPLIAMRQVFEQYACVRPALLLPGIRSPLAGVSAGEIDMLVVRENSEGEYVDAGGHLRQGQNDEMALQTAVHTRQGIARILRYAFRQAQQRTGRLTMATKSNALQYAMVLWDRLFAEIASEFPDVQADKVHVDALSMQFVLCPQRLDVVVASNLFGDILSDLAAAITGSLGLAPSANINPERTAPSLFEPVHGSAPDIAGKGIANPIAAIRSAAMLLDFLGESPAARAIDQAVIATLRESAIRTPDLGGAASTAQVGDEICGRIAAP